MSSALASFFAILMLTCHSVVPHHHDIASHAHPTIQAEAIPTSLWALLSNAFAINLGEGHLEHYVSQADGLGQLPPLVLDLSPMLPFAEVGSWLAIWPAETKEPASYRAVYLPVFSQHFLYGKPLRAPPIA